MWKGRLRVMEIGSDLPTKCLINLEDKDSGELFAQSPYQPTKQNPHGGCEAVLDSSRYFVLTVVDQQSGQKAYIGMGFPERTESFDFNVALQGEHFFSPLEESRVTDSSLITKTGQNDNHLRSYPQTLLLPRRTLPPLLPISLQAVLEISLSKKVKLSLSS